MWSLFFSWISDMTDLCSAGKLAQFYKDYFMDPGVCGEVLCLSALIALVFTLVFYFVIGNFFFTLSRRITWIVFLLISPVTIYFVSDYYIIGTDGGAIENSSGLYKSSYTTEYKLLSPPGEPPKKGDEAKKIRRNAQEYRDGFKQKSVELPHEMAFWNSFYGVVFFIVFSFGAKRFSKHAKFIPLNFKKYCNG